VSSAAIIIKGKSASHASTSPARETLSTQSQNSTPHAPSYAFLGTSTSGPLKIPRSLSLKPPVPPNFISSADLGSEHAPFSGHGFWKHRRPSAYTLDPWLSLRLYSPVPSAHVHSCFCLHFRQHLDPYCLDPFPSHCPRCPPNFLSIEPPHQTPPLSAIPHHRDMGGMAHPGRTQLSTRQAHLDPTARPV
jgi:hypothetical protein